MRERRGVGHGSFSDKEWRERAKMRKGKTIAIKYFWAKRRGSQCGAAAGAAGASAPDSLGPDRATAVKWRVV